MGCLRLFLAIAVLLAHTEDLFGIQLLAGSIAVQAFFAISGFYMSLVLHEKYQSTRAGTLMFLGNRVLRIWPTYLTILLASLAVAICNRNDSPFFASLHSIQWPLQIYTWFTNVFIVGLDSLLFFKIDQVHRTFQFSREVQMDPHISTPSLQLLGQGWSLAVELYFYLLAPWLVRLRLKWIVLIACLSLSCKIILAKGFGLSGDPFYYRFFPSELATFLFGAIAYHAYRWLGRENHRARKFGWWCLAAIILFGVIWMKLGIPMRGLTFALFVTANTPFLFIASKASKWDRWIGELSYPLYISHTLVVDLLGEHGLGRKPFVVLPIALGISLLLIVCLERPIDRWRQKLASKVIIRDTELSADGPMPVSHRSS